MGFRLSNFRLRVPPRERRQPKTYKVDPEAVANLKRILAEQEKAEKEGKARRRAQKKATAHPAPAPEPEETDHEDKETHVSKRTKFQKKMTAGRAANWARLRREGHSYEYITKNDSLSPSYPTIKKYLKEYGYTYDGWPVEGEARDAPDEAAVEETAAPSKPPTPAPAQDPDPLQGLVDVAEAAQRLGVHEESVRRYLRDGTLAGEQVHGKWLVEEEDLVAFMSKADAEAAALTPQQATDLAPVSNVEAVKTQLAAVQNLMQTLQASDVRVSGTVRLDFSVEIDVGGGR